MGAGTMLLIVAWLLASAHMISSPFGYQAKMGRNVFWGGLLLAYTCVILVFGWHLKGWVG
jgi:hypothetical protein